MVAEVELVAIQAEQLIMDRVELVAVAAAVQPLWPQL
jgi:hypothetical protein